MYSVPVFLHRPESLTTGTAEKLRGKVGGPRGDQLKELHLQLHSYSYKVRAIELQIQHYSYRVTDTELQIQSYSYRVTDTELEL